MATAVPRAAICTATALPIPLEEPVTKATLPSNEDASPHMNTPPARSERPTSLQNGRPLPVMRPPHPSYKQGDDGQTSRQVPQGLPLVLPPPPRLFLPRQHPE